jgi:hypothetical protein
MKRLTPIAAAAAMLVAAAPALAIEQIELGNGLKLDARVNLTYTVGTRLKDADSLLKGSAGSNDGNNNFAKNALTANRLVAFFDGKLSKDASGLVVSASAFYDDVYHKSNDNNPGNGQPGAGYNPNGVSKAPPFNEFTRDTNRYHGGYSRFLDAYGYTSFNVGEQSKLNLRLGRHVVSWGEALFFPGISLAQGPADGTKTGVPGTETKDQLLPEDQVSFSFEVSPRWSILGHAQFNFHPTLAPAPGSYLNTSDGVAGVPKWLHRLLVRQPRRRHPARQDGSVRHRHALPRHRRDRGRAVLPELPRPHADTGDQRLHAWHRDTGVLQHPWQPDRQWLVPGALFRRCEADRRNRQHDVQYRHGRRRAVAQAGCAGARQHCGQPGDGRDDTQSYPRRHHADQRQRVLEFGPHADRELDDLHR